MRFNLQLFAQTSIVDLLKSQGKDSSFSARKELAQNMGITNYSGTAEQNMAMIKALGGGGNGGSTAKPQTSTPKNYVSTINGVDQSTINKMNSGFNASSDVLNAQREADSYLQNVKNLGSVTNIVDQSTWDALNKKWETPQAITDAWNYTNSLLEQLSSGRTSYTDQIKGLMGQIQNRDKFSYDVDSDVLFQQYLASSMASGKTAMQDTMGQASALTGGYGSTYATSAANQQYNAYIQDAYNNLPEYYQMAMETYQMEGEEMYNQLAMLSDADATEYQRMYDSWQANFNNTQNMYNRAYGEWQDGVQNAYNSANLQLNEHGQIFDQAYRAYAAVSDNAQQMYQNEYNKWADEVNNAFKYANMANSDYWNTANFNESVRQYNASMAQRQAEHSADMDYKNRALAQDQDQFEASLITKASGGGTSVEEEDMTFNTTEINGIKKAYRDAGGGESGYEAVDSYLKGLGKYQETEEFQRLVDSYINSAEAQDGLPAWYQTWNITNDTKNHNNPFVKGNEDLNDVYANLSGDEMTYKELKKAINNSSLSDAEKEALLKTLRDQSKK